jgi:putative tryptophan/tyrosine transport system substrate-binding protein
MDPLLNALRAAMRDLDYVEGRSIHVEARSAQDNAELRGLAREFVRQKVDVIVTNGRAATRAAQEATASIPIVMAPVDDPYEFVASLARPSGNITGLALQQTEVDAKQLEILKEAVPSLLRLAIFYYYGETYYALESVAHALSVSFQQVQKYENGTDRMGRTLAAAVPSSPGPSGVFLPRRSERIGWPLTRNYD